MGKFLGGFIVGAVLGVGGVYLVKKMDSPDNKIKNGLKDIGEGIKDMFNNHPEPDEA